MLHILITMNICKTTIWYESVYIVGRVSYLWPYSLSQTVQYLEDVQIGTISNKDLIVNKWDLKKQNIYDEGRDR